MKDSKENKIEEFEAKFFNGQADINETLFFILQLSKSMYQENQRDREAQERHYEEQKILLHNILEAIKEKEVTIEDNTRRIGKLEASIMYHTWILGIIGFFTSIISGWAVPRILGYLFP